MQISLYSHQSSAPQRRISMLARWSPRGALGLGCLLCLSACQTPLPEVPISPADSVAQAQTLREADVIKISFPGAPNLETTQTIRPDGRITIPMLGELRVVGMTPLDVEKALIEKYKTQLVSSEVSVSVVSSSFVVYVSGAVMGPGKIQTNQPITALEAIMQGGGFSPKANAREVEIIRIEQGRTKNYRVNLQKILDGESSELFYLRPQDMVFVREKFQWF